MKRRTLFSAFAAALAATPLAALAKTVPDGGPVKHPNNYVTGEDGP